MALSSDRQAPYRSPHVVVAEARRIADDIRRRAQREANDVRRAAAEWASATRRDAEEYRERVLAEVARTREASEPGDREAGEESLPPAEAVPRERVAEAPAEPIVEQPAEPIVEKPDAEHQGDADRQGVDDRDVIDLRSEEPSGPVSPEQARADTGVEEATAAVWGSYVVGHRPPSRTGDDTTIADTVREAVRRTFLRQHG